MSSLTPVVLFLLFISMNGGNCSLLLSVEEEKQVSIAVELLEWDMEAEDDGCELKNKAEWNFLTQATTDYADSKVEDLCRVAASQRQKSAETSKYLKQQFRSSDQQRRVELISRPGDALLGEQDFRVAAEFTTKAQTRLRDSNKFLTIGPESKDTVSLLEVPGLLAKKRNATSLQTVWLAWQSAQEPSDLETWPQFLNLAGEVANLNGARDLENYWETLSDWPGGYAKAKQLWREIEPLYRKLHGYVRRRLQAKYTDVPNPIPVHLLGSPLGYDWTYIADLILPEPNYYKSIETSLKQLKVGGKNAHEMAQRSLTSLGFPGLGNSVWDNSVFDGTCPSTLISGCLDSGDLRVYTCNDTTWQQYLAAHETVLRSTHLMMLSEDNSYIFRHGNRHSAVSEALTKLGSLLASPAQKTELLEVDGADPTGQRLNLLLLLALRILPRLPYLLAADVCRLREIHASDASPGATCWQLRKEMQGVAPPSDENLIWWDALGDDHFTSNQPYLSEFVGTILQFQLLEFITQNSGRPIDDLMDGSLLSHVHLDDHFRALMSQGLSKPWPLTLADIEIDHISSEPMLRMFKSLIPLLDDMAPVSAIPDEEETSSSASSSSASSASSSFASTDHQSPENTTSAGFEEIVENTVSPLGESEDDFSKSSTTFIAFAVVAGVGLIVAAVFVVNKIVRKNKMVRHNNGSEYHTVVRNSGSGRPVSFSPIVAKRLSENNVESTAPQFSTFKQWDVEKNDTQSDEVKQIKEG